MPEPDRTAAAPSSRRELRVWGRALLLLVIVLAVARARDAAEPVLPNRLDEAQRRGVGRAAAALEVKWREKSRKSFPGDLWSQDDDTHNAERSWVQGEARRRRVPVSDVLRAIDEDLRAHPVEPPRKAGAAMCKPRPFYD